MATPAPTLSFCDDDDGAQFYVDSIDQWQKCVWLASRLEEYGDELCADGHAARNTCPETCGVCRDNCEDSTAKFMVDDATRDCLWLSLRPPMQASLCIPGSIPFLLCGETCHSCDGAVTNTPTPNPAADDAPAALLADGVCDDDAYSYFFVESLEEYQRCIWLASRPEEQQTLCRPEDPSGAFHMCSETCGKCTDTCNDTSIRFMVGNASRDCLWLSLRPAMQELLCVPGSDAWFACGETCGGCDGLLHEMTPAPSPAVQYECDDSKLGTFFVADLNEFQRCVWLESRPDYIERLCMQGHAAYDVCPETCGKCLDNCLDGTGRFDVDDKSRDCLWLSLRPEQQTELCHEEHPAYHMCPETCDVCDVPRPPA